MNRNRYPEAEVKFFTHCPFGVLGEEQPLGEAMHLAEVPLGICLLVAETEEKNALICQTNYLEYIHLYS